MKDLKILLSCEESQRVTKAFRKKGVEAYSNDIEDCSGGRPEWHIKEDALDVIKDKWDAIIAFPPCTHLAVSGAASFAEKRADGRQQKAVDFFMSFVKGNSNHIAIENPVGIMSNEWRRPNQYIHPYEFGDPYSKKTGLWLIGLPKLVPTKIVKPEYYIYKSGKKKGGRDPMWHMETLKLPPKERRKARSKLSFGIAKAMAEQWTPYLLKMKKLEKENPNIGKLF